MLAEDAALYFPLQKDQDPNELYAEILFDHKQFFLSSIPWSKSYNARFNRIRKIHEAYLIVSGSDHESDQVELALNWPSDEDLRSLINCYQQNEATIKLCINQSRNLIDLEYYGKKRIENRRLYAKRWPVCDRNISDLSPVKSIDPMLLLGDLEKFEEGGLKKTYEVVDLAPSNLLYEEWIQLSLWLKKEKEVGK